MHLASLHSPKRPQRSRRSTGFQRLPAGFRNARRCICLLLLDLFARLEIGTFYGRSTATICSAIAANRRPTEFISCDLDFRSASEFSRLFGAIHCLAEVRPPAECNEAFSRGLSTLEYARLQLDRYNFTPFVQLIAGDFRRIRGTFDMIFADVLHDEREIEANLPGILDKIENDGILAVHDITDGHRSAMQRVSRNLQFISQSAHLGLFRFES